MMAHSISEIFHPNPFFLSPDCYSFCWVVCSPESETVVPVSFFTEVSFTHHTRRTYHLRRSRLEYTRERKAQGQGIFRRREAVLKDERAGSGQFARMM